jgi:diguanylate cyclase (GGDEF)-like protein
VKKYFKKSFEKFTQDALSKLFYDILKWLLPATAIFAFSKFFPDSTSVGQLLSRKLSLSIYVIILCIFLLSASIIISISIVFYKKYNALKNNSLIDELTGLKNHKAFEEYLTNLIVNLNQSDKTFSIIMIDVDNFKRFNTEYSPNIADGVLSKVGELLRNDKRITDEVFRQFRRGDEFIVIASDTNLSDAIKAAERKRNLIGNTTFAIEDTSCKLSVSCGVTEYKRGKDDFVAITDRVNKALVEAKSQEGKNNTKSIV